MPDDVQPPSDSARSFSSEATAAEGTSGGAQQLLELERGEAVGRYLVLGKIGAGGIAVSSADGFGIRKRCRGVVRGWGGHT